MGTVGIVANPHAGKDIRRLVARAASISDADKISIVQRVMLGAVEGGATRLLVMPDRKQLCARAAAPLHLDVPVESVEMTPSGSPADSQRAAEAMAKAEVGTLVVLGGDGTCRDVVKGWLDAPLVALSTGTNNVFPGAIEATTAGVAAGLVASGRVDLDEASDRAQVVHASIDGEEPDLALVDLVLVDGRFTGSRAVWDPAGLRAAVVAVAEPASVGLSAIAALARPHDRTRDGGVSLRFGPGGAVVRAPLAPGLFADVPVAEALEIDVATQVAWTGPGVLTFDGERDRVLDDGTRVWVEIRRDGPRVVDVGRAIGAALATGFAVRSSGDT